MDSKILAKILLFIDVVVYESLITLLTYEFGGGWHIPLIDKGHLLQGVVYRAEKKFGVSPSLYRGLQPKLIVKFLRQSNQKFIKIIGMVYG